MSFDCNNYFLRVTAVRIWQSNDREEEEKMFDCFSRHYKRSFFKRVVYEDSPSRTAARSEIAEGSFLDAWQDLHQYIMDGKTLTEDTYIGFVYTAFWRKYWRREKNRMRDEEAEKVFLLSTTDHPEDTAEKEEMLKDRIRKTLDAIKGDCGQLLRWKYLEDWTYDKIAGEKNFKRKTAIVTMERCRKRFAEIWKRGLP